MEISRDGRRVPELIDTSALGAARQNIHTSCQRERETSGSKGKGRRREKERERERQRPRVGSSRVVRTVCVNWFSYW